MQLLNYSFIVESTNSLPWICRPSIASLAQLALGSTVVLLLLPDDENRWASTHDAAKLEVPKVYSLSVQTPVSELFRDKVVSNQTHPPSS